MIKIEYLIILSALFVILLWAISRCGSQREKMLLEKAENSEPMDTARVADLYGDLSAPPSRRDTGQVAGSTAQIPAPTAANVPASNGTGTTNPSNLTRLYIVMDGVNLRSAPQLQAPVVAKLPLFEEVYFLNEVTDSTQQLSIGKEIVDEPWVKVRTLRGREGWVYGAYVGYYKKKRKGAI